MRSIFDLVRREFRKVEEYSPDTGTLLGIYHYLGPGSCLHREDGPAVTGFDAKTGACVREAWYRHGKRHRADGPAVIVWVNGRATSQEWYLQGALHRPGGLAARLSWAGTTERVVSEEYFEYGRRHRLDGAALIERANGDEIVRQEFWIDGVPQSERLRTYGASTTEQARDAGRECAAPIPLILLP